MNTETLLITCDYCTLGLDPNTGQSLDTDIDEPWLELPIDDSSDLGNL